MSSADEAKAVLGDVVGTLTEWLPGYIVREPSGVEYRVTLEEDGDSFATFRYVPSAPGLPSKLYEVAVSLKELPA